ncbi:MAG TPA: ATP-dependent DNA helicase RecG, partial [Patescibacteria group bacterium]|nr:ATP-dependent DNA helicase RecG [Patescibacteria group bacterium]
MDLKTKVRDVSRVYKMYSGRLERLGIQTVEDFLYHIPFRYDDFGLISKIGNLQEGEIVTIRGKVQYIKNLYARRFIIQKARITDETGVIDITWFNQPYITKMMNEGDEVSLSGKVQQKGGKLTLLSPEYEVITGETLHTGRLVPVYPETRGVSSKWLRRQVHKILEEDASQIKEILPGDLLLKNKLMDLKTALYQIHFPDDLGMAQKARERLSFDEFLSLHLRSISLKKSWAEKNLNEPIAVEKFKTQIDSLIKRLPFELTKAQERTISEIFSDLSSNKAMNRLLQGEVGSGKTIVAAIAIYLCFLNKKTSVLIAPTEILANQHYKTISNLFEPLGIEVSLVTSSSKKENLNSNIFVGTHAILHRLPKLKDLSLIVIDEQQRFGVEQRGILREKGDNPNILTMTATPIPRTVALTVYGNLSLSFLNEMPKDRKKVKTWLVPSEKRDNAYKWIGVKVKEGDQAFIVCPFIEESETLTTVRAATKEFEKLKTIFSGLKLGLLHGRVKAREKEEILKKFKNKKIDILVTTPIV